MGSQSSIGVLAHGEAVERSFDLWGIARNVNGSVLCAAASIRGSFGNSRQTMIFLMMVAPMLLYLPSPQQHVRRAVRAVRHAVVTGFGRRKRTNAPKRDTPSNAMAEQEITITAEGVREIIALFEAIGMIFDYFDTSLEDYLNPQNAELLHKWLSIFHTVIGDNEIEQIDNALDDEMRAYQEKWKHHGERDDEDGYAFNI